MDERPANGAAWSFALAVLLLAFLGLGTVYVLRKPLGQAPDESDHVTYVLVLKEYGSLPRMWTPETGGIGQGDEPPLYYLSLAAVLAALDPDLTTEPGRALGYRALRIASLVLYGLGLLLLTLRLCRTLAPGDRALAFLTVGLTAFLPMFLHIASSVSNGIMADCLAAALLVRGVRGPAATGPRPLRSHVLDGSILGIALLTKMTVLPVAAVAGAVFVARAWREPRRAAALAALVVPVLLIAAPWFIRNTIVYGDPVAFTANMETFFRVGADSPRGLGVGHLPDLWRYFVGVFGFGMRAAGAAFYPDWVYVAAAAALSAWGAILLAP
jgi:hypothetical protein